MQNNYASLHHLPLNTKTVQALTCLPNGSLNGNSTKLSGWLRGKAAQEGSNGSSYSTYYNHFLARQEKVKISIGILKFSFI